VKKESLSLEELPHFKIETGFFFLSLMVIQRNSTPACLRLLSRIYFFQHLTHEQFAPVSAINAGYPLGLTP
jgi:hypothetical protein